jgi:DNA-binding PadR family transcriptional regulator
MTSRDTHREHDHGRRHGPPWASADDPWARGSGRGPARRRGAGRGRGGGRDREGFDFEGGPFFGRGPRAARGDIRVATLQLLDEEPMHGYQIMSEIRERSGGVWKPSPGSVYPTLQQLEDEGLIASDGRGGKKVFHLTEAGHAAVAAIPAESATPWLDVRGGIDPAMVELRRGVGQVTTAVMQVVQVGSDQQMKAAQKILSDTRRQLYRLLAEDDAPEATEPEA